MMHKEINQRILLVTANVLKGTDNVADYFINQMDMEIVNAFHDNFKSYFSDESIALAQSSEKEFYRLKAEFGLYMKKNFNATKKNFLHRLRHEKPRKHNVLIKKSFLISILVRQIALRLLSFVLN